MCEAKAADKGNDLFCFMECRNVVAVAVVNLDQHSPELEVVLIPSKGQSGSASVIFSVGDY